MRGGKKRQATQFKHYNKHPECYVICELACTSSLIHTDRRTDTGRDIVASCSEADSHKNY